MALGFRSLLIKLALFFAMAMLLAWALGGTLWPRAETHDYQGVGFQEQSWFWRLTVGGRDRGPRWRLMTAAGASSPQAMDQREWVDAAGPLVVQGVLYYGGRLADDAGRWRLESRSAGADPPSVHILPDRLALEQQLARVSQGLPIQDAATIQRQRPLVLDPS